MTMTMDLPAIVRPSVVSKTLKILVVDDDDYWIKSLEDTLQRLLYNAGYRFKFVSAQTYEEAREILSIEPSVDLLVTDIRLLGAHSTDESGIELVQIAAELDMAAIAVSAVLDAGNVARYYERFGTSKFRCIDKLDLPSASDRIVSLLQPAAQSKR